MVYLVRSTFFILQSTMLTFFITLILAISHLLTIGRSPKNLEKVSRRLNTIFTGFKSFLRKNCQEHMLYRNIHALYFHTIDFLSDLVSTNKISETRMKNALK